MIQKNEMIIISLIVLLVVAVVALFILLFSPEKKPFVLEQPKDILQLQAKCQSLCNGIDNATPDTLNDAVWAYCTYTGTLQKSDYASIIMMGAGDLSFCRDGAHCFNLPETMCSSTKYVNQSYMGYITPKICLQTMCKKLKDTGKTQAEAEKIIKSQMVKGSCDLREGAKIKIGTEEKTILVPTWWEEYFENPNCSVIFSGP